MTPVATNTIAARLWPQTADNALVRAAVLVLAGNALLTLSAYVQVPFWPVKLSMQSFVVLALGIAYGGRLAGATVLTYLIEGAAGLPVFVSGGGLAYFTGPTAGFLVGFLVAAISVGWLAEQGAMNRFGTALTTILVGETLIFAFGVAWLAVLFGPAKAVAFGLTPFLLGEALKVGLALALVPAIRRIATGEGTR